jgi:hypothetical protein
MWSGRVANQSVDHGLLFAGGRGRGVAIRARGRGSGRVAPSRAEPRRALRNERSRRAFKRVGVNLQGRLEHRFAASPTHLPTHHTTSSTTTATTNNIYLDIRHTRPSFLNPWTS